MRGFTVILLANQMKEKRFARIYEGKPQCLTLLNSGSKSEPRGWGYGIGDIIQGLILGVLLGGVLPWVATAPGFKR